MEKKDNKVNGTDGISDKSRALDLILCFLFGFLGAHRFYEGKYFTGILYLCTLGFLGLGEILDFFRILGGRATDSHKRKIVNW